MIKKTKLIPIICGICATTAAVIPAVGCTCSFDADKLEVKGGSPQLTASTTDTEGGVDVGHYWELYLNGEQLPHEQWDSYEIVPLDSSAEDFPEGIGLNDNHELYWPAITVARAYTFKIVVTTTDGIKCESQTIVLDVNEDKPDAYTISGPVYFDGVVGTTGSITTGWKLMKEGSSVTEGVTFAKGTGATEISIADDGTLSWTAIATKGVYDFEVIGKVNGEDVTSIHATLNISLASTYKAHGGSLTLNGHNLVAGADTNHKWEAYLDGHVQTATDYKIDFTTATESDAIVIDDTGENAGIVRWTNQITAATYKFTVTITDAAGNTYVSDEITLIVPVDHLTISGGSLSLDGFAGESGIDKQKWSLYLEGVEQTVDNYEITNVSPTPTTGDITIDDTGANAGFVQWNNLSEGKYTFNVGAEHTTQYPAVSGTVTLNIGHHNYGISGGTNSLALSIGTTGVDTGNAWVATKDGKPVVAADNIEIGLKNAPTFIGLNTNNELTWTNAAAADTTFQVIAKDKSTNAELASANVKLVVKADIAGLEILGDDEMVVTAAKTFEVKAYPASASTEVTWSIPQEGGWAPDVTGTAAPILNAETGVLTFTDPESVGTLTVIATSKVDSTITASKQIRINYPWVNSHDVWMKTSTTTKETYLKVDMATACDGVSDIATTKLDGTNGTTFTRNATTWNDYDFKFGDQIEVVPNFFLSSCIGYNGKIDFSASNKLDTIGDGFMYNCSAFNQTMTLPNSVTRIGDDFMEGCIAFTNNGVGTFAMPTNLTKIGIYFFAECTNFNCNLTIGEKVDSIGAQFLYNCPNMCSTLTINTDTDNFDGSGAPSYSFAAIAASEPKCHNPGITLATNISGAEGIANLQNLIDNFGELTGGVWRNLHIGA